MKISRPQEVEENKIDYVSDLHLSPYIEKAISLSYNKFSFLNFDYTFSENIIDWNFIENGKLWAYNLNYMDYLLQPGMQRNIGVELINTYIDNFTSNNGGKEPYPISLRGINWIKFISKYKIQNNRINNSLLKQYIVLFENIEYHLLGNHLLENGFSLLFGAFYFNNKHFYKKAKKILQKELDEQILTDGGHFELSPMYHQIILDRLLDVINLLQNNKVFIDQNQFLELCISKATKMLSWLNNITFLNGDIPHFNDSTNNIAPTTKQLFDYATNLNLSLNLNLNLSTSGYRKFKTNNYECIVDAGPVGPDYIPGHAHADMLSFVLYVDSKPFIVDCGVSTYEKNETRQKERSTISHNTVTINNRSQSDVWGGFRVGKRAKIKIMRDTNTILEAEHNGYKPNTHKRQFNFNQQDFSIIDTLSNSKTVAQSFMHFHPDREIKLDNNSIIVDDSYTVKLNNSLQVKLEIYNYPLGYNKYISSQKVVIDFKNSLEQIFILN
jgi:hypothetical protein